MGKDDAADLFIADDVRDIVERVEKLGQRGGGLTSSSCPSSEAESL